MQIEYISFCSCSGYGESAIDYVLSLDSVGVDVKLTPVSGNIDSFISRKNLGKLKKLQNKAPNRDRIQIYHMIPSMQRRWKMKMNSKTVGFATYECTDPPKDWFEILKGNDLVVAPSRFCYTEFNSLKNLVHIPHAIDFSTWKAEHNLDPSRFVYLAIGTWRRRKGWEELMISYKNIESPNTILKILIPKADQAKARKEIMKHGFRFPPEIIPGPIDDVPGLMNSAHCIVCPTRGEGFGLVGAHALALAKPLIITNYSGCQDYISRDTCELLEVQDMERVSLMDGIHQFRNKRWPTISTDDLSTKMKYVYNNYDKALLKAEKGLTEVEKSLSYKVVGKLFADSLAPIWEI